MRRGRWIAREALSEPAFGVKGDVAIALTQTHCLRGSMVCSMSFLATPFNQFRLMRGFYKSKETHLMHRQTLSTDLNRHCGGILSPTYLPPLPMQRLKQRCTTLYNLSFPNSTLHLTPPISPLRSHYLHIPHAN